MSFTATTRASVYRATTESALGDNVNDNTTPVSGLGDLRASLIEKSRSVMDPASGERRTVRFCIGRLDFGTDVRKGDRIKDNRGGQLYAIDEITPTARTIAGGSSLVLDLRIL